jgi:hypothetical protein
MFERCRFFVPRTLTTPYSDGEMDVKKLFAVTSNLLTCIRPFFCLPLRIVPWPQETITGKRHRMTTAET